MQEVTIELAAKGNAGKIMFTPFRKFLRGRWDRMGIPANTSSEPGLLQLNELPGMYISLDIQGRRCRVYDPLALPRNADRLKSAQAILKHVYREEYHPAKEEVFKNLSEDNMATILHWMREMVDRKQAVVVEGSRLPPADVVKGKITVDPFNRGAGAKRFLEDFKKPEAPQTAGAA